ncbi:non-specific lipid-transfer protein isoform 4 proprotein [Planoprotostelium fungivorum]|uniref:Non-specific lipid-transfer protein isoform 4 proprotein n=1 Tax=Planoprotostelium fungivorum TaxID=1890364 RepID=A0A2P6NN83_9EUKA|nr:non-specific lipid-transfer protein isoform 4 proprotein [Planoprotostelium fungivorum]
MQSFVLREKQSSTPNAAVDRFKPPSTTHRAHIIIIMAAELKAAQVFKDLETRVTPDLIKQLGGVYQFDITKDGKTHQWTADLKNGKGSIAQGPAQKADCTITANDDDFTGMMTGKLNPQQLFMNGKLKVKGNMGLAMKLTKLQPPKSNL